MNFQTRFREQPLRFLSPLSIAAAVLICGAGAPARAVAQDNSAARYKASQEDFPNPERGFFIERNYNPGRRAGRPDGFTLDDLRAARTKGMTIVRAVYTLTPFRDALLSPEFLAHFTADFALLRQAGFKVIPRFAYNAGPIGAQDASLARVLEHIEQLKPILRENADVIAFVEAGFAGAWGEWHSSTNGMFDTPPPPALTTINDKTRAIVAALLAALPDRMVALRCPRFKEQLTGPEPLSLKEAFTGTLKARIGAHNDCLLATEDDMGTYTPGRMAQEKQFLHQDNLFVPQFGETCSVDVEAQPFIGCANAVKELDYLRYTALNSDYNRKVLQGWETGGCMGEIQRRMGYRFRLVSASLPARIGPGETLSASLTIANDGWASLYNPRPVELVLRNTATKKVFRLPVKGDPRFWEPGQTKTIEFTAGLPAGIEGGTYDVLLRLPDPSPKLADRAEYAIRLANEDVWEALTGMNSLRQSVTVVAKP